MGVVVQRQAPVALPPEKTWYPLHRILSHVRKSYVIIPISPYEPSLLLYVSPGSKSKIPHSSHKFANGDLLRIPVGNNEIHGNMLVHFILSLRGVRNMRRWERKLNYVNDV